MGNQFEKEYNIKEKPLKLPGSYNFLRFIHHPAQPLSLIVVKSPHRATPVSSTLLLPIKQIRQIQGGDSVAVCHKCLPLALVKPKSETQMRILMHKIIKSSTQIGRCFFYSGRIMLWCEEKRGNICSLSPEEIQHGKPHPKSKVFVSGIALINFLHCVYNNEAPPRKDSRQGKKEVKLDSTKEKIREKLKEKGSINQSLPQQIKLFFQPKDKKEYYENYYTMETRLAQTNFWTVISQGLRELLLNMVSEDPEKRIDLPTILSIPYFMESNQLRLYSTLADDLQAMVPKEAKIFMTALELLIKEGLTIEHFLMEDFFRPVLCSMVTYNSSEGKENDFLLPMVLSILIELDKPPTDIIYQGFRKSHAKNIPAVRLALSKKVKLQSILPCDCFESIMSRALFSSFESQSLLELAIVSVPFAMKHIQQANYRKEIELQLIGRVLAVPKQPFLLEGLKCMIYLLRESLVASPAKLEAVTFSPLQLSIELNFHILYLYGLMIESFPPLELLEKMMPKLQPYLNEIELYDEIFVVAKRCVDRILERLYEQRKINPTDMIELQKSEDYFDMKDDPTAVEPDPQQIKLILRKEIEKHELDRIKWTSQLLI